VEEGEGGRKRADGGEKGLEGELGERSQVTWSGAMKASEIELGDRAEKGELGKVGEQLIGEGNGGRCKDMRGGGVSDGR